MLDLFDLVYSIEEREKRKKEEEERIARGWNDLDFLLSVSIRFFFRLYAMQLFRNGLLSLLRPALILRNYTLAAGE